MTDKAHEKLNGWDYIHMPHRELVNHPDFSPHAFRIIGAIFKMTTKQLENINVIEGDTNAGRRS